MKKLLFITAALTLAACNNGEQAEQADQAQPAETAAVDAVDPNADAGFEAVAPGHYEIVRADGTVDQLMIQPGMTWSMVSHDGAASGGTIFAQGGKNCFVTEGVEGHQCFAGSPPEEDGSMEVTGDEGETATIRPVESFSRS
jgi:hypothetical protein